MFPTDEDVVEVEEGKKKKKDKSKKTGDASSKQTTAVKPGTTVMSLQVGRVVVSDAPSGKRYDFPHAGAKLPLEPEDLEFMDGKTKSTGCCGSPQIPKKTFDIV